ncbi:Hint domain-containing protein [Tabrizicola sp.]|uniref:Hint domain-containing protein n=1 Tax=Tabrizicola sp. TaxID=2005166 RepID=UPI003F327034
MAENTSTSPATGGSTTLTGTAGVDSLSGGGGADTIYGGDGADNLSGDAPLAGQWQYRVYDRDFPANPDQTQFISSGTLVGTGYVDDFGVRALRNTLGGAAAGSDRNDYGVIYSSTISVPTTGTYTFSTTSDDGSRIIIRDANGNIVYNLNNDFHQGATTRSSSVTLTAGQTYTIEVYYWENQGGEALSATIAGPGFGATDLATSSLIQAPPLAPGHVDGNDSILGDGGNDTIAGGGGDDRLYGGADGDSIRGDAGQDQIFGGDGADRLYGGAGADVIFGGAANDTIDGGSENDTLNGDAGDDSILGDAGQDQLYGGVGADRLYGGSDWDLIFGGNDGDQLYGDIGNDTLYGDAGNDLVFGGPGADQLFGAADRDRITFLDGDFSVGDSVDGGSTGDDYDILDLSGYGWARTDITYTSPDRESGIVEFYDAAGNLLGQMAFSEIEEVIPCFTAGTLIDTPLGPRPVESIRPGDLVDTLDDGPQVVRWVGHRSLGLAELVADPSLWPVQLEPGSIGLGLPSRTLTLSPQHRVLLSGALCELYFGIAEVLAPAVHLADRPGVRRALEPVTYVHLMFDRHQIVRTEGVWSESFQPGPAVLAGMPDAQQEELFRLFPDLASGAAYPAARSTLKAYETYLLADAGL